jgi:hypothetical protein
LQYLLWLVCITVLLLFQLFRHEHTSRLQDVWWGDMWIKNWNVLEGSSHKLIKVLAWIGLKGLGKAKIIYESVQIWTVNFYITIASVRIWTNSSGDMVHILSVILQIAESFQYFLYKTHFFMKLRHWIYHLYLSGRSDN